MKLELPELPYAYDALAPQMSAETLEYHHDKHHNGYVNKTKKLLEESDIQGETLEDIVRQAYGRDDALFNNAAQHYNHMHFWNWMKPKGGGAIPGSLEKQIKQDFGSEDDFRKAFIDAGTGQFGSGWCWLMSKDGKLQCAGTPNGENPLIHGAVPILGCDVWEHSYYLDHRNDRKKYLQSFLDHLVNWEYAAQRFEEQA